MLLHKIKKLYEIQIIHVFKIVVNYCLYVFFSSNMGNEVLTLIRHFLKNVNHFQHMIPLFVVILVFITLLGNKVPTTRHFTHFQVDQTNSTIVTL